MGRKHGRQNMAKIFLLLDAVLKGIIIVLVFLYYEKPKTNEKIFEEKTKVALRYENMSEKIINVAESFNGVPHLNKTYDNNSFYFTFDSLDYFNFVELTVAISLTSCYEQHNYKVFQTVLKKIRYENGLPLGYASKHYYFLGWTANLISRQLVTDFSEYYDGIPLKKNLNYISSTQKLMRNDSIKMVNIEKNLSKKIQHYIPKNKIYDIESKLLDGDIIAFVSPSPDRDIMHTGFVKIKDCHPYLLHSSPIERKISLTKEPLGDFVSKSDALGIIVIRITQNPKHFF